MARRDEAVLKVLLVADLIAAVLAGRFPFAGGATAIGEFLAVIRQDLGDLKGSGLEEVGQEALGAGRGLFRQDLDLVVRFIKIYSVNRLLAIFSDSCIISHRTAVRIGTTRKFGAHHHVSLPIFNRRAASDSARAPRSSRSDRAQAHGDPLA